MNVQRIKPVTPEQVGKIKDATLPETNLAPKGNDRELV